ncbi:hydroxymethylglutaryl-CoA lyase [Amycolatopsis sp. NBRC 101858]|uniref:hydroxymethylglutaryl-CoA lyase n=1 Tax=Amycolatopsis sp. NBRC 101858 TaxID=3032200 RepID=UPI0024A21853|nr:hydroxymethylglutaryl-CoA lyase [Amycolatopsis sp. NBRC 101858]GLY40701.1 hydroxymethylglutaryl-CoA lyase [Amycolatopsis sp. NBRC 101858]
MTEVLLTEVVLRDGLQDEAVTVPTHEKVRLARGLVDAGVRSLEVGSFVSARRVPQMADTGEVLKTLLDAPAALHSLVFTERGAQQAIDAGAKSVRLVVSASDGHSVANAGVPTAAALDRLAGCAALLTAAGVAVEASVATAFVCPFDGDTDPDRTADVAARLGAMGARVVHLADTIGAARPSQLRTIVSAVRDELPDVPLGLHLHNTYGLALANAWEGFGLGIRRFDAALGGLGGCPFAPGASGNVATDDLVDFFHREGIATGIDVAKLTELRDQIGLAVGHRLGSALAAIPAVPATLR